MDARPLVALDARLVSGSSTGDSTYWTSLLDGFARVGLPYRIALLSDKPRPDGVPERDGFSWIVVPARSSRWWSLVSFPLAARRLGARVIHTQYSLSPLVGRRGVTTVHDLSFLIGPEWFRPRDRWLLRATVPAAIRRSAKTITVSETSKEEIERLIPAARGKVVATPLACPNWIQRVDREVARAQVVARFGLDRPFALTTSTRWPRKNMQLAIDAMEGLPTELGHVLAIAGKSGWGELTTASRVRTPGYVEQGDLCALYSAADVYLAPSRHEGFGIPALEAMRCGCAVVASMGGALPEVVGDDGVVVRSWDPADWSREIAAILREPSKLADLRSRALRADRRFSWEETARKTLAIYEEVMR